MAEQVRQLSLQKKEHTYIFRWRDGDEAALIAAIVALADRRELDWWDAAVLVNQLRLRTDTKKIAELVNTQAWITKFPGM